MVDEFVDLCPPNVWEHAPETASKQNVFCDWRIRYDKGNISYLSGRYEGGMGGYKGGKIFTQKRLTDGSFHIDSCDMNWELSLGDCEDLIRDSIFSSVVERRRAQAVADGKEKVLQEAQSKLDAFGQFRYGISKLRSVGRSGILLFAMH